MKNSFIVELTTKEIAHILDAHFLSTGVYEGGKYTKMLVTPLIQPDGLVHSYKCQLFNEEDKPAIPPKEKDGKSDLRKIVLGDGE